MNKKFLSAILFGALMVTSTGTFVSCKDYDEDIENLQGQISSLATKSEVEAKLNQLQSAIDAAKAEAVDAADLAALEAKVTSMQATIQAAVEADIAGYKAEIEALIKEVEAVVGEIADFVTSVELDYRSNNNAYYWLDFFTITEKENVFEDGLAGALTFTKGKQIQVAKNGIIVRVNPTNAVLTPEMISLVNSKGENLDEYVDIKVEKYTDLLTRAATNNGLWKITPVLKEYNEAQFKALKYADVTKGNVVGNRISYAVQINNALEAAEARYVTSPYSIQLNEWEAFEGANSLCFKVDGKSVMEINNRFDATSKSLPKFDGTGVEMYKELVWLNKTVGSAHGPAATEAILKGDKINVAPAWSCLTDGYWSVCDNRSDMPAALAVQGKPMVITIDNSFTDEEDDDYESKVAGLYVTLDYEANAVESTPSEWNAWNSYKYTGLNTVVKGTSIEITIDSEETINDYIGFRVYAVNHDGTLLDPDGRAFYVLVGEQAAEAQTVTATITPTNDPKSRTSVTKALTDAQSEVITALLKAQKNNPSVVMAEDKADKYGVTYTVKFNKSDDGKKYVSATFELAEGEIADMINDKVYKASIVYKNENGHELGTVNFELTKTMPTAFPADFAFRPKQETEEGSGKFIAYMIPEGDSYAVPTPFAANGFKDLDNVFYGLDKYYKFAFATSAKNADKELIEVKVVANEDKEYILEVGAGYIDNATAHAVSVWYTYPGISTYSYIDENGKEAWKHGATHEVAYDKAIEATYACWEDASAFDWGTEKVGDAAVSLKPILKWTAEGVGAKAKLSDIVSTNSYNNDFFGVDLESMLNTGKWLAKSATDGAGKAITTIQLKAGEQVNPYFVPTIEGNEIKFTQKNTQLDAAPTADHTETLEIVLVDAFGHQVAITLDVTVKAPEKK